MTLWLSMKIFKIYLTNIYRMRKIMDKKFMKNFNLNKNGNN